MTASPISRMDTSVGMAGGSLAEGLRSAASAKATGSIFWGPKRLGENETFYLLRASMGSRRAALWAG